MVCGTEGDITARLTAKTLIATPDDACLGFLEPKDLVLVDLKGKPKGRRQPSSEIKLHLQVYKQRPDCMAVVHAHPPTSTGFSVAGEDIPDNVLPVSAIVLGSVPVVAFGMPGTDETAYNLEPLLDEHKTFMLSHHGALTLGSDVFDALYRMESLENVCDIIITARLLGDVRPMPSDAFDKLLKTALNGRLD